MKTTLFGSPRWQWLWAILLIAGVNGVLFYPHYLGEATFPWDFLRGYHAHAFGWYAQGGIFSPPKWFPWSSMGFPAALAIQSGAWYAPLILLDALNITYSIHVATVVQCLHVIFGAFGAFVLFRAMNFGFGLALLGAICFELSAGFYSNQQHVDIIRAYALFPWLLWGLLPVTLNASKWRVPLVALLLFQFLIAAYPGNIVAAAYAGLAFGVINLCSLETATEKKRYAIKLLFIGLIAVALSGVKWLPYAMQLGLMEVAHPKYNPFQPQHLLTLLFDYDVPFLTPGIDVTARSVFVPSVVLVGAAFACVRNRTVQIGWMFVVMALGLGCVMSNEWPAIAKLMGLRISRFPLTDWRPVLTVGLIIVGLDGWQRVMARQLISREVLVRAFVFQIMLGAYLFWAWQTGYSSAALLSSGLAVEAAMAIVVMDFLIPSKRNWLITALLGIAVANGSMYESGQKRTWLRPWSESIERAHFGVSFSEINQYAKKDPLHRRPPRQLVEDEARGKDYRTYYFNSCWYQQQYCILGYDNLKYSVPHKALFAAMQDPTTGQRLTKYVKGPQQLLIRSAGTPFDITKFAEGVDPIVSLVPGVAGEIVSYGPEEVRYRLTVPETVEVVENELWWPGWRLKACRPSLGCEPTIKTGKTSEFLRTWQLRAGSWTILIQYY